MNLIQIVYDGDNKNLAAAVGNANSIINSGNLFTIIQARKKHFYNTDRTCEDIAQVIFDCTATIKIEMFTRGPNSNGKYTTGYADLGIRDVIHFNTEVLGWRVKTLTNTLVHETVHIVICFMIGLVGRILPTMETILIILETIGIRRLTGLGTGQKNWSIYSMITFRAGKLPPTSTV